MRKISILVVLLTSCAGSEEDMTYGEVVTYMGGHVPSCDTQQIFGKGDHSGKACPKPNGLSVAAQITTDPSVQEENSDFGFYAVHAGQPLTKGPWVFVPGKSGYTTPDQAGSQTWTVQGWQWYDSNLQKKWSYTSSWKPTDAMEPFGVSAGYEQLFQPVLTDAGLWVPSFAGQVVLLDPETGSVKRTVDPLAGTPYSGDAFTVVNSAISTDTGGNVFFTVVALNLNGQQDQPRDSFLVRVAPNGAVTVKSWKDIATAAIGVVQPDDMCTYQFFFADVVPDFFPPSPDAEGPQFGCFVQMPTLNAAPAVTKDGHLIVMSTGSIALSYAYLIEVDAVTLAPVWSASLRGHILDRCGVKEPFDDGRLCPTGTHLGYDPNFNTPVAGRIDGLMENAPVIAPDGSVYVGSYSGSYDNNQGHTFRFASDGTFLSTNEYGWETTPAILTHKDGTWDVVQDFNQFSSITGDGTGPDIDAATVRFTANLQDATLKTRVPVSTGATANDFLDGQPQVDQSGNTYALNASGNLYQINGKTGAVMTSVDLGLSLEALSSEMAWGTDDYGNSVLYVPFAGKVWVVK